jgi:thiamine transport system permease protein
LALAGSAVHASLGHQRGYLGLGYVIALDEPPLNRALSPAIIPIAHTLVAMPFVNRIVCPP